MGVNAKVMKMIQKIEGQYGQVVIVMYYYKHFTTCHRKRMSKYKSSQLSLKVF